MRPCRTHFLSRNSNIVGVACACCSTGKACQGFCVRTSALPPASFRAHSARYRVSVSTCPNLMGFDLVQTGVSPSVVLLFRVIVGATLCGCPGVGGEL